MVKLSLDLPAECIRILCLGAHSDDLEIGCGGTVLKWLSKYARVDVTWVVLSSPGLRHEEARESADAILGDAKKANIVLGDFRDGYLPAHFEQVKNLFEELKEVEKPDVIFTHRLDDRHQDHRLVGELTWQTFRDHLILEYEIPKYEGDLGQANVFVPVSAEVAKHKIAHLENHFGSQRSKNWFRSETFLSVMQLRGIECRAEGGYAEAFYGRKLVL